MKRFLATLILAATIATGAQAANTMTANITNTTGSSVSPTSTPSCSPPGSSCTLPSISNNTTRQVIHRAVQGAGVGPLLIVRYAYFDFNVGPNKSCQLTMNVAKSDSDPSKCELGSLRATFLRTDGTGSSPNCGQPQIVAQDYANCTFEINLSMSN